MYGADNVAGNIQGGYLYQHTQPQICPTCGKCPTCGATHPVQSQGVTWGQVNTGSASAAGGGLNTAAQSLHPYL